MDIDELATLIYYPEEKIKLEKERKTQEEVKKMVCTANSIIDHCR